MNMTTFSTSLFAGFALLLSVNAAANDCSEIVLGSVLSLTGKYSTSGTHTKNGYEYAISKIKQKGGVKVAGKCYNFKVIYRDDESRVDRAVAMAEWLINEEKVQYMLGPYSSALTSAIAPVTEKYQVPMIEAEGASRALFNKGYQYLFAVLSTSEQYLSPAITLAAKQANERGFGPGSVKVALAVANDPFSLDVRAGVLADAELFGMQIVLDEKLSQDATNMSDILSRVKSLKPDLFIVSGYSQGAATAVWQIDEKNIKVPMIAMTHCEAANITGYYGAAANNILCATQWAETLTYEDELFGSAPEYEEGFKAAFPEYRGKSVPYQSAQASAAVYVFKDAFERAGTMDRKQVRDAIAATDLYTFYGHIKFSETGKNTAKPTVLRQIQDGEYNVVAPSAFASHELVWPRP